MILGDFASFFRFKCSTASTKQSSGLKVVPFERAHPEPWNSSILETTACVHFEIWRLEHGKIGHFEPVGQKPIIIGILLLEMDGYRIER